MKEKKRGFHDVICFTIQSQLLPRGTIQEIKIENTIQWRCQGLEYYLKWKYRVQSNRTIGNYLWAFAWHTGPTFSLPRTPFSSLPPVCRSNLLKAQLLPNLSQEAF